MMKSFWISVILLVLSVATMKAQNSRFNSFTHNESIAYCITSKGTPNNIVRLDNNWEILLALREPHTIKALDSINVKFTYSQLQLLADWKLIRNNKNKFQTNIIILDSLQTLKLRNHSKELSEALAGKIGKDVADFVKLLKSEGRERNSYSILFSYVIDGLVWKCLEERGAIRKKELSMKEPLWSGEFWTLYPKRDFYCGTNTLSSKGYSLKINWSEGAFSRIRPFISNTRQLDLLLRDFEKNGKITEESTIAVFSKFNLFNESGHITVPILEENDKNSLYLESKKIADSIADFLEQSLDIELLRKEFGFADKSQAIVIMYHEILWDLLAELENKKIITKPTIFIAPDAAQDENVSDLIFFVKR